MIYHVLIPEQNPNNKEGQGSYTNAITDWGFEDFANK
ncbi:hypothetical protein LCGC14_2131550 [marine sediment metagenome]|uniref:Uncharacterized protein n=1 Tax=marine sediment metagenome TaxID=412755 RepID=A0A0F9GXD5_9ZZZZ